MRPIRAFLAVPLPDAPRRAVTRLQRELAEALPRVHWVDPETIHLTLRFFGDIPEESLEKIGEVMLSVGRLYSPFQTEIRGVGAFPAPTRPRVIWLGVTGEAPMSALYAALDEGLRRIGFPGEERPFSPHLTLGRARERLSGAPEILDRYRDVGCGTLPVDRLVLYESRLLPAGAVHLPRRTVYLGDGREPAAAHDH